MKIRKRAPLIKGPFDGCGMPCAAYCGLGYLFSSLGSAVWAASLLADDEQKCCMPDKGCCNVYCQFQWCAPCAACKFYAKEVTYIDALKADKLKEPMPTTRGGGTFFFFFCPSQCLYPPPGGGKARALPTSTELHLLWNGHASSLVSRPRADAFVAASPGTRETLAAGPLCSRRCCHPTGRCPA